MRILPIIYFSFFFASASFAQNADEEKIQWRNDHLLTWEDFKGTPDEGISYSANTNSGISYSWSYSTASGKPDLSYEVFSNFYPYKSWVKEIEDEEYLLAHEQLHFDISELHARKLRKALNEYIPGRNIRQDLKDIYNRVESERSAMQNLFDKESQHSENREEEIKWRNYIAEELKKLEDYSIR